MSNKQEKKLRRAVRKHVKVEAHEISISLQNLITSFRFYQRFKIAWRIVRGKPFLGKVKQGTSNTSNQGVSQETFLQEGKN